MLNGDFNIGPLNYIMIDHWMRFLGLNKGILLQDWQNYGKVLVWHLSMT